MKFFVLTIFLLSVSIGMSAQGDRMPAIVIHGGAGNMQPGFLSDSTEQSIEMALQAALDAGYQILDGGGTATDAILKAITLLENSPYFNAGKGAVMTRQGSHELDASFMEGRTLNAGAVTGITIAKNPILAAHAMMYDSPYLLLSGAAADSFAAVVELERVPNSYYTTEAVRQKWISSNYHPGGSVPTSIPVKKHGTVGAVAIDKAGNIAAGTSTGGLMNKESGRVGDSPIIGAGTYADNRSCGVSCTGQGEFFMRVAAAKEISDQLFFANKTLLEAMNYTIVEKLFTMSGSGGAIAIDKDGKIEMVFNTPGMYRGWKKGDDGEVLLYGEL